MWNWMGGESQGGIGWSNGLTGEVERRGGLTGGRCDGRTSSKASKRHWVRQSPVIDGGSLRKTVRVR
ncbi:hypothetical protein HBI56_143920 [Parastagonospora nodorum]|uniref:Uncharacterized protein n=1 Tax=Phaeosphaeria nodorum (strain SN15 / ATCC MYA-4574 / FGSC 10173) TaxID=321614 RepID=A0A7U2F7P1_PHANO|nr:hypothetical protein HBH56_033130 [Parastagonospora nodorum]QRD00263.1 hypothetical protein JI435_414920 [Parastagonospora nodorum SN15]KAH3933465.1 hypothetical protein HBH54_066300 [Parastagonospora nodorum]KAH3952778.1 hypothetical protein HBH53_043730 [Parastagonospora nodorum]KAH3979578.1 hypothetical protein HBH51_054760 [Parastagonospora nodorum]